MTARDRARNGADRSTPRARGLRTKLTHGRTRVHQKARDLRIAQAARTGRRDDLRRLGSRYGGWTIPTSLLSSDSICYSAGVGEDVTFDLALIERLGCDV